MGANTRIPPKDKTIAIILFIQLRYTKSLPYTDVYYSIKHIYLHIFFSFLHTNTKEVLMKILCVFISLVLCLPVQIQAKQVYEILIQVENSEQLYIVSIEKEKMKVEIIETKVHIPIRALNNEISSIQSVNFNDSPLSLLTTINQFLQRNIQYYVHIEMETLLNDLHLSSMYDYETLDSLCKSALAIKEAISLSQIMNYQNYIDTNISVRELFEIYTMIKDELNVSYYTLSYLVVDDMYIPIDKTFYEK